MDRLNSDVVCAPVPVTTFSAGAADIHHQSLIRAAGGIRATPLINQPRLFFFAADNLHPDNRDSLVLSR